MKVIGFVLGALVIALSASTIGMVPAFILGVVVGAILNTFIFNNEAGSDNITHSNTEAPLQTPGASLAINNRIPGNQFFTDSVPTIMNINNEEEMYEYIANEIEHNKVRKGLWTKLLVECEGNETKVKLAYIRKRVEELKAEQKKTEQLAEQEVGSW